MYFLQSILSYYHDTMASFYSVALFIVTTAHLALGLGNIFKVPPYKPSSFLIAGQPGTGESGIEKLLEAIMGGWYTVSILTVILAYFLRYIGFHPQGSIYDFL